MKAICVTINDPFCSLRRRDVRQLQQRQRIRALAPKTTQPHVCFLNGRPLLRAGWSRRLHDGDTLAFVVLPQGGGGKSNPLAMIATIALMVYAGPLAASLGESMGVSSAIGMGMIRAGVMMVGSMLINALLPPPRPSLASSNNAMAAASPTYNLSAQGNQARLGAPIPVLYGLHKVFPDFAAQPYGEFGGNEQYLYELFVVTQGKAVINSISIADASIEATPNNDGAIHTATGSFTGIDYQIIQPGGTVSLFPSRVITSASVVGQEAVCLTATYSQVGTVVTVTLPNHGLSTGKLVNLTATHLSGIYTVTGSATWDTFTVTSTSGSYSGSVVVAELLGPFPANPAGTTINLIAIDVVFPRGLFHAQDNGDFTTKTVSWKVEAAPLSDTDVVGTFFTLATESFTDANATPQRRSYYYYTPSWGRYTVRLTRTNAKDVTTRDAHEMDWVGMRGYVPGTQDYGNVTLLALKMKASSQLSAAATAKISVVAQRHLPVWDGSTWTTQATRSIAWAFADAALNTVYGAGLPEIRLDLAGLLAQENTSVTGWSARGDTYDGVFDSLGTCWEALTQVARAGRAMPVYQGGILYAIRDSAQTLPVAMFSPRNIVKGSFKLDYVLVNEATTDSVEVTYFDETAWAWKPVLATLPGDTALQPAKVQLPGVTSREQAWREGMYMAACNRYRRRFGSHQTEMEGLIPRVADLIAITHDMPAWGVSGDVMAHSGVSVGDTLTLSEPVAESGTQYIALSKMDGSVSGPWRVTTVAASEVVTLVDAITDMPSWPDPYLREKPRYALGATSTTLYIAARVLTVSPASTEKIDITWVVESASVHTADNTGSAPFAPDWQLPGVMVTPIVTGLNVQILPGTTDIVIVSWQPASGAITYHVDQVGADGVNWNRCAEVTGTSWSGLAMYGAATQFRVSGVGVIVGPWSDTVGMPAAIGIIPAQAGALTNIFLSPGQGGFFFSCDTPTDPNYAGLEIHVSTTTGFTPNTTTLAFAGPQTQVAITRMPDASAINPGVTLYVRAGAYNSATRTGMIYSAQQAITPAMWQLIALSTTAQVFSYDASGTATPASQTITITALLQNLTGTATFVATLYSAAGASLGTVTLGGSGNTRTLTNAQFAAAAYCTIVASYSTFSATATINRLQAGAAGTNGTRTAVLDLYQWAVSAPGTFPSGSSTYTWSTGQFTAPTLNGWSAVPGVPVLGQTLWIARQLYADTGTSTTSTVNWAVAGAIALSAAGANGQRVGFLEVYQWGATAPALPTGTSTYTWATGVFTAPSTPNGWSLTPPGAVAGQTLWGTSVRVSDTLTTASSTVTWTGGSAYAVGSAGTNGVTGANGQASRVAFVVTTLATVPAVTSGTGDVVPSNSPTGVVSGKGWSFTAYSTLAAGEYMYQVNGLYTTGGNTVWGNPYLSNLKVGSLSALSANIGTVTAGRIQNAGNTNYFSFDATGATVALALGTGLSITGAGAATFSGAATINSGSIKIGTGHTVGGAAFEVSTTGVVYTDGIFGGTGYYSNYRAGSTIPALSAYTESTTNTACSIEATVIATNTQTSAHAIKGTNLRTVSSGLVGPARIDCDFYAAARGAYLPFTGSHDALIAIGIPTTVGDIYVDAEIVQRKDVSNTLARIEQSSIANQSGVIGIATMEPVPLDSFPVCAYVDHIDAAGPIMNPAYATDCTLYNLVSVNALGEGQINVCGRGGDIARGDLLVTSSMAGKGMKQADNLIRSHTVAKSRENVTFATADEVKMIACIYLCG